MKTRKPLWLISIEKAFEIQPACYITRGDESRIYGSRKKKKKSDFRCVENDKGRFNFH